MTSSNPSSAPAHTAPQHAAPTLSVSRVDISPEPGLLETIKAKAVNLWSKAIDLYAATFKADERIDRLSKMPAHQKEIRDAATQWRTYSDNVNADIKPHVKTVGEAIGKIIETSGNRFSEAMKELDKSYKEITGLSAIELTPAVRRTLSIEQLARLVNVYESMNDKLSSGKIPYIETASRVVKIYD